MRNVNSMCSPKAPLHMIQHSPGPRWSSGTSRGVTILPNMHVNETWSLGTLSTSSYALIDSLLRRGLQAASGCRGARRHSAGCRDTPPRSARTVTASAHEASTPKALTQVLSGPDFSTALHDDRTSRHPHRGGNRRLETDLPKATLPLSRRDEPAVPRAEPRVPVLRPRSSWRDALRLSKNQGRRQPTDAPSRLTRLAGTEKCFWKTNSNRFRR